MHLHTIRVIPKAAIVRTDTGFHIDHVPGLWTQDAEGSGRIHGTSTHLDVVGLLHQATLVLPVGQEAQDNILKAQRRAHDRPSATVSAEGRQLNGGPFPATVSAEGRQLNGGPFPATVSAEGRQLNGGPSFIAMAEGTYPTSRAHAINITQGASFLHGSVSGACMGEAFCQRTQDSYLYSASKTPSHSSGGGVLWKS